MVKNGAGPCGHSANKKHILIKIIASCLSFEVPTELVFSANCIQNDKNTETISFEIGKIPLGEKIYENQHACGVDFTQIRCNNSSVDGRCTLNPKHTWTRWFEEIRIKLLVTGHYPNQVWQYVQLKNDDKLITEYLEKTQGDKVIHDIDSERYGEILAKGCGNEPHTEVEEQIKARFFVDYTVS